MNKLIPELCKESVYPAGFRGMIRRQCSRKASKDGYCSQHHPDAVKKREKEVEKRDEERRKNSPYYRLAEAHNEIKKLNKKIKQLQEKIKQLETSR